MASVSEETRQSILAGAMVLEAKAGDVLLRQGETDKAAFFVLKGRVVVKREEGGRFRITRSVGPGEQFGEDLRPCRNAAHGHGHRRRAHPGAEPAGGLSAQADEAAPR